MSRMNHVMQMGIIEGKTRIYLEDYAYTYLKKQEKTEKKKYFLYGEREEKGGEEKIYIYGISDSPKTEHTYFKEYQPLGFIRYKQKEKYWVNIKGQEILLRGFFIFYAPNSAMQEYLVDTSKQKNEADKQDTQNTRKMTRENPPIKETFVSVRRPKYNKKKRFELSNLVMPATAAGMILLFAAAVSTPNGQQKVQIFRQIISDVINDTQTEEEFIVEEKSIDGTNLVVETMNSQNISDIPTEETVNSESTQDTEVTNDVENKSVTGIENDNEQNSDISVNSEINNLQDLESSTRVTDSSAQNSETYSKVEQQNSEITGKPKAEQETSESQISTSDTEIENTVSTINEPNTAEVNYKEYIVQEGDTLAAICKNEYGSLVKMEEICDLNQIKNADHIAPGQKIYLP